MIGGEGYCVSLAIACTSRRRAPVTRGRRRPFLEPKTDGCDPQPAPSGAAFREALEDTMAATVEHATPARSAWAEEARASLALSWPLILTNAAQTAMTSTDVLVMGRLGPDSLAAGALGANLFFAFLLFGVGVTSAAAP